LRGDGKGNFTPVSPAQSGLSVTGEARSAVLITPAGSKNPAIAVSRCDGPLMLFTPANH